MPPGIFYQAAFSFSEKSFLSIFWVLRTLRYQWQNCGQLRKYGNGVPGKGLCPFHSRKPFKKGLTLNF